MGIKFTSLNSGSNGNCYYVGNNNEGVLIDAGLSTKETERRMQRLNLSMHSIKAIFISHEHIDHVRGLAGLAIKYGMPIYVTDKTKAGCYHLKVANTISFKKDVPIKIGSLSITAFTKHHDAADPHSFIVTYQNITVGIFTDIGIVCKNLMYYFKQCHAAFLEANYDSDMLENGKYPPFLKIRITGGNGHLSNAEALSLFINHKPTFMSHLLLSHLSKDNNCPILAKALFEKMAGSTSIQVASRQEEMEVMEINFTQETTIKSLKYKKNECNKQLTLF